MRRYERLIIGALDSKADWVPLEHFVHLHKILLKTASGLVDSDSRKIENMQNIMKVSYIRFDTPRQRDDFSCGPCLLHLLQRFILKPRTLCKTLCILRDQNNNKKVKLNVHEIGDAQKKEEIWDFEGFHSRRSLFVEEVNIILEFMELPISGNFSTENNLNL
jgi:hypothetical protein